MAEPPGGPPSSPARRTELNRSAALALAAAGLFVFPCRGAGPGNAAKQPVAGLAWPRESTTDPARISSWWRVHRRAIPAIDLGKSGLIAIDCDAPHGPGEPDGVFWFRALAARHGLDIDAVPGTATGRNGRHLFFRQPDPPLGNSRGALPPRPACGVDVRGAGGYVIAPGAELPDGRRYAARGSLAAVTALPEWVAAILTGRDDGRASRIAGAPTEAERESKTPPRPWGERAPAVGERLRALRTEGEGVSEPAGRRDATGAEQGCEPQAPKPPHPPRGASRLASTSPPRAR